MKQIRSRDNPYFKSLLKLSKSARERQTRGLVLLDGDHLIETCCNSGMQILTLAISESALQQLPKRILFESVPAEGRLILADRLLDAISPVVSASGLVAVVPIPDSDPFPVADQTCLLLEGIQDPGNIGTILRTAVAAGIKHVALSPGCASAWGPKSIRAGMGAHFHTSIHEHADLSLLLRQFQGMSIATQPNSGISIYDAELSGPVAWLFGNEGAGLSSQISGQAKRVVSIPMPGPTESLNVASAVAICLFEQVRQKKAANS